MTDDPWVRVAAGHEIANGSIHDVTVDDVELVIWRSADGTPCAMDARCPHQYSHLAVEGSVAGDEIICCTHYWRFAADGTASYETATGLREPRGRIDVYPVRDDDGAVWVRLRDPEA